MTPHEALKQQCENVEQALAETLRYDYGPEPSRPYYEECKDRLDRIKQEILSIDPVDFPTIKDRLDELSLLSVWISLIERSRLGEFSWPFAYALRDMAQKLLVETHLSGERRLPIIHVVTGGEGYLIDYETPSASGKQRFAFIAFPRSLKHHVLLHALFGHELGHTALHAVGAGTMLQNEVMTPLESAGPLANPSETTSWLNDANAPREVKDELNRHTATYGQPYEFDDYDRQQWLDELICDLFGLLLFGPGFAAAHQVYMKGTHPNPYEIALPTPTHPPYAVRQRLLTRAMQLLNWDNPVSANQECRQAEGELLHYVLHDPYARWSSVFSDAQLQSAIAGIQNVFSNYGSLGYKQPNPKDLTELVLRLAKRLPPILAKLDGKGKPQLREVVISHTLYAGWIYWFGRNYLTTEPLSFLETNKLCDHALLQQRAINIAKKKKLT